MNTNQKSGNSTTTPLHHSPFVFIRVHSWFFSTLNQEQTQYE
ncbi:MAG TPA: hypothetical protein VFA77_14005 [Candidatus Eisenbacteria bacterium]|nr:hypothetical protein [Candidatus Eisenbacteria bacterium]